MTAVIDSLAAGLAEIPSSSSICVGLSGGLDSVVLLHALTQLNSHHPIRAYHVNHQLSQLAGQWQQHCEDYCAALKVDLAVATVDVNKALGESGAGVEAIARRLRYDAFAGHLKKNEVLLLAHHMDDQMETFLLRLMRGAGVHGLQAMPESRTVGAGRLARPFLSLRRAQLLDYAEVNELTWVNDESNSDSRYDRNFCRHEVLPTLATRWPNYRESWSKSLSLIAEAAEITAELARHDIDAAITGSAAVLSLAVLDKLSEPRRRSALRYWLASIEAPELGWKPLNELVSKLKSHQGEAQNLFQAAGFQLVAYRDELHALRILLPPKQSQQVWHCASNPSFTLPDNGELSLQIRGDSNACISQLGDLAIRYRQGGERLKLLGRPTKSLKQLLQEAAIPPWLRDRLPLIYSEDELVYVPMVGGSEQFALSKQGGDLEASIVWCQPKFNWC